MTFTEVPSNHLLQFFLNLFQIPSSNMKLPLCLSVQLPYLIFAFGYCNVSLIRSVLGLLAVIANLPPVNKLEQLLFSSMCWKKKIGLCHTSALFFPISLRRRLVILPSKSGRQCGGQPQGVRKNPSVGSPHRGGKLQRTIHYTHKPVPIR